MRKPREAHVKSEAPTPRKTSKEWQDHCRTEAIKVGQAHWELMKPTGIDLTDIDWLAVAVGRLGGVAKAARAIKRDPATIYKWLNEGLEGAAFGSVVELSRLAGLPLEVMSERRGVYRPRPRHAR